MGATVAFRQIACELNRKLRDQGRKKRIHPLELVSISKKFSGRCAYCGVTCIPRAAQRSTRLYFDWYIPLERGGETEIHNLIPVCSEHLYRYRPTRRLRETIPDVNTFGDLIQVLIQSVVTMDRLKRDNNVEAFAWEEKIKRVKRSINSLLEEIMISTQYHPFTDWKVEDYSVLEENINTLPDIVKSMTEKEIKGKPVDKTKVVDLTKQILSTKQYKIVRKE